MCLPLGPRRAYSRWGGHTPVKAITKAEVDEIISDGGYTCFFKRESETDFREYDCNRSDLIKILHNGKTRVRIAGSATPGYRSGYETVVMRAPSIDATILLRYPCS